MLNGLKSIIDLAEGIDLSAVMYRKSNLLGAEDITRNILTDNSDIDVIFCTNAKDTVAAARVIIERNLVGDVYVVGTDVTEEIINYIQKGIVFGVLDRNGYDAGYKCVEILYDNFGDGFQPSYMDIDIDIYTSLNIASYRKN
jgi:ribose transport system substrate-binding protein